MAQPQLLRVQVVGGRAGAAAWRSIAPDLLLVHRPLPHFAEGAAASSPDAKRVAGCTRAALKPLEVLHPCHRRVCRPLCSPPACPCSEGATVLVSPALALPCCSGQGTRAYLLHRISPTQKLRQHDSGVSGLVLRAALLWWHAARFPRRVWLAVCADLSCCGACSAAQTLPGVLSASGVAQSVVL